MVYITDRARTQLKVATDQIPDESEWRLRLGPTADGKLVMYPDRAQEADQIIEHDGVTVLLIGRHVARALAGRMIDFEERESGFHFTLREAS
jgi:Fe-S cluster assembly iron-binding protein IscA